MEGTTEIQRRDQGLGEATSLFCCPGLLRRETLRTATTSTMSTTTTIPPRTPFKATQKRAMTASPTTPSKFFPVTGTLRRTRTDFKRIRSIFSSERKVRRHIGGSSAEDGPSSLQRFQGFGQRHAKMGRRTTSRGLDSIIHSFRWTRFPKLRHPGCHRKSVRGKRPNRCDPVTTERAEVVRNEMARRASSSIPQGARHVPTCRDIRSGAPFKTPDHHTPTPPSAGG